jgi:amino acid adenylation domain-containing protein
MTAFSSDEVRARVEKRLAAGLAALRDPDGGNGPGEIRALATGTRSVASYAQRRLWFIDRLQPGSRAYLVPAVFRITGPLDVAALTTSLRELVQRHEALRTTFSDEGGELYQVVADQVDLCVDVVDLPGPAAQREDAWQRAIAADTQPAFDLRTGPLVRARLFRCSPDEHRLFLNFHHIVVDGWSLGILVNDLAALYATRTGGSPGPDLPPLRYRDYTLWQRARVDSGALDEQLKYWERQLTGLQPTELRTGSRRPEVLGWGGSHRFMTLDRQLTRSVQRFAERAASTPFMVLLTAFATLLQRYCGCAEIVVGTPIAGRTLAETEAITGMMANVLVLRTDLSGDPTFVRLLSRVRDTTLDAFAHQDVPFELLVERLRPDRDPSRHPLFQIAFAMQDVSSFDRVTAGPVVVEAMDMTGDIAKLDLSVIVIEAAGELRCVFEFNTDLFDAAAIDRLAGHYRACLAAVLAQPELRTSAVALLDEAETNTLLHRWSGADAEPDAELIPAMIARRIAAAPEAIAVCGAGAAVTYRQLGATADHIAARLSALGCGAEDVVAVCAGRSVALVAALLGTLWCGACYLPLDPTYPADRLEYLVGACGATAILADEAAAARFAGGHIPVLRIAELLDEIAPPGRSAPAQLHPRQLAYVVYTSGSTGSPKGVAVEHAGLTNLVQWHLRAYALTASDHCTLVASPGFDASAWELWTALAAGATLHIPGDELRSDPAALAEWLADEKITTTFLPTALAEAVLAQPASRRGRLRFMLTGGDALARVADRGIDGTLVNHYGPTEGTVVATAGAVALGVSGTNRPAIGRPIDNARVYVLDRTGQPAPIGVPGELYLGGAGVARGYLGDPARTAERFVPDPFSGRPGSRLYRTGDEVRWLPDGQLDFVGRIDNQVKIRGFRVELGEVEAAVEAHPAVREAVVTARGTDPVHRDLIAAVVLADGATVSGDDLRTAVSRRLPAYMVPAAFVAVERIPLNASGKVDRRAVSRLDSTPLARRGPIEPASPLTPTEAALATIWCELLGLDRVDRQDSFFELGGHSFLALQLQERLRDRLRVEAAVIDIFDRPTLAMLASHLDNLAAVGGSRSASAGNEGRSREGRLYAERRRAAADSEYARRRRARSLAQDVRPSGSGLDEPGKES